MRFWLYKDAEVPGTFEPAELAAQPDFMGSTLVCPAEGDVQEKNWKPAAEFPELKALLDAPKPEPEPLLPSGVERFLDTSNHGLFTKVTELMRALEEERRLRAEKERELARALSRIRSLESRAAGPEVERDPRRQ